MAAVSAVGAAIRLTARPRIRRDIGVTTVVQVAVLSHRRDVSLVRCAAVVAGASITLLSSCGDDDASPAVATPSTVVTAVMIPSTRTVPARTASRVGATSTPRSSDDHSAAIISTSPDGPAAGWPDDPNAEQPNVTLIWGANTVVVGAHSYDTRKMAADGTTLPPTGPVAVVESADLVVEYPLPEITLHVQAESTDGSTTPLTAEQISDQRFRLVAPPAGTYDVWLTVLYRATGNSYEAGTGHVFRWIVPPS
jgi:hypothetical protein